MKLIAALAGAFLLVTANFAAAQTIAPASPGVQTKEVVAPVPVPKPKPKVAQKTVVYQMYGLGNVMFSSGMDVLGQKLAKIPGVTVKSTYGYLQWRSIVEDIKKQPVTTNIVVNGNSMGANRATNVAAAVNRPIALVSPLDPTIWTTQSAIGTNVKEAFCVWNSNPFSSIPPVGHARCSYGPKTKKGTIVEYETKTSHTYVDDDPKVHDIIIKKVRKIAAPK